MFERLVSHRVIVAAGAISSVALLSSGCSHPDNGRQAAPAPVANSDPSPQHFRTIHCKAKDPAKWEYAASNFNVSAMAEALGVTQQQVTSGAWGGASCQEGITADQVLSTKATVQGIGSKCLVLGLSAPPQENKIYHGVLAICAAPIEITPSPASSQQAT